MTDMMSVKYEGETYNIPGIWMAGFCREGRTIMDGIAHWHSQAQMDKAWRAQKPQKRRCDSCHRAVGTKSLNGAIVYSLHTPPGGGYCVGSDEPVPARSR